MFQTGEHYCRMISHLNFSMVDIMDDVIKFLKIQPEINQKLLAIIGRNFQSSLKFWFEPEIAFALKVNEQPTFVFAIKTPSDEFIRQVFNRDDKYQGTEFTINNLNLNSRIIKISFIMVCDKITFKRPILNQNHNSTIYDANQEIDSNEIDQMIKSFSNELSLSPIGSHQKSKELFPRGSFILSEINSQVSGCVYVTNPENNVCRMTYLYVKPDYRRLGLAQLLVEAATKRAILDLSSKCILYVNLHNIPAKNIYESFGYNVLDKYFIFYIL